MHIEHTGFHDTKKLNMWYRYVQNRKQKLGTQYECALSGRRKRYRRQIQMSNQFLKLRGEFPIPPIESVIKFTYGKRNRPEFRGEQNSCLDYVFNFILQQWSPLTPLYERNADKWIRIWNLNLVKANTFYYRCVYLSIAVRTKYIYLICIKRAFLDIIYMTWILNIQFIQRLNIGHYHMLLK